MKQNIFSVFQQADSDDEVKKVSKNEVTSKPTKKQAREEDHVKREQVGDKVEKDVHHENKARDGPKPKGDYKSGERRPFDRHSGTGKPAFTHDFKKGGHGKGNVGTEKDGVAETDEKQVTQKQEEPVAEPKEEIIIFEDYLKDNKFNADFMKPIEEIKIENLKITDPNVKVIQAKKKEVNEYSKKNVKHVEDLVKVQNNSINFDAQAPQKNQRKTGVKKTSKLEFNEDNFPTLN